MIGALRLSTGDSQIIPVLKTPNKYLEWKREVVEGKKNILAMSNTLTVILRVNGKLIAPDISQVYSVAKI